MLNMPALLNNLLFGLRDILIEKNEKKHDCFSIFFSGCNQSQIFPRSICKSTTVIFNKKVI